MWSNIVGRRSFLGVGPRIFTVINPQHPSIDISLSQSILLSHFWKTTEWGQTFPRSCKKYIPPLKKGQTGKKNIVPRDYICVLIPEGPRFSSLKSNPTNQPTYFNVLFSVTQPSIFSFQLVRISLCKSRKKFIYISLGSFSLFLGVIFSQRL